MVKKRDPGSLNLPAGGDPPIRGRGMLQGHRYAWPVNVHVGNRRHRHLTLFIFIVMKKYALYLIIYKVHIDATLDFY